ncbi:MAG: flippase-like domain-containing protein [Eubacterium sp.]|nr:flippase-like domain-containing protein [Eubacterium sp.]
MKIRKRTVFNIVFLAAVLLLTLYSLTKTQDMDKLGEAFLKADVKYIIIAAVCVLGYMVVQAVVIWINLKTLGYKLNFFRALKYAFLGYFFLSITPFGMGGPAMQIVSMKKDEIPVSVSSIVVLLYSFIHKGVLVLVGIAVLIFGNRLFLTHLDGTEFFFGLGMFLTAGFSFLLALFTFHPSLAKKIVVKFMTWLEKKHIMKHKEGRIERITAGMNRYRDTAAFFKAHAPLIFLEIIVILVQRFFLFAVTYFVYRAFGLSGINPFLIMLLQSVVSLCVDMLPIPGGMGISEFLFAIIFNTIFTEALVMPGLVLSRGISYYIQLLLCGIITLFAYAIPSRIKEKKNGTKP